MRDNICWIRKRFATIVLALVLALSPVSVFSVVNPVQTVEAATVKLSKTSRTMKVGQAYKLTVKGPHGAVKWKSSKSSVAAVDNSGVVRAKKKGTAYIYARVGKKTLRCRITVKSPAKKKGTSNTNTRVGKKKLKYRTTAKKPAPSINKKSLTIYNGGTFKLTVEHPTSKVRWSSSNKKVATVNSKGIVVAKKNGKATITAKMGRRKLRCIVVVKSLPAPATPAPSAPAPSTPAPSSNPVVNTPGSTNTPTTPSQPSTEHVHDWKLVYDYTATYYCGEPLRYVCTGCGQMFEDYDALLKHMSGFLVSDLNVTDVKIYQGPKPCGSYAPDTQPQIGTMQFLALGGPAHQYVKRNGTSIYGIPLTQLADGSYTDTETAGLWTPSNEAYEVFWNGSSAKTMGVCSCGAIFANQECLDRHIKLVNDLNTKLAANMGTTPYLHHKKGTGVECGICKETRMRTYKCSVCGEYRDEIDSDYPKSLHLK